MNGIPQREQYVYLNCSFKTAHDPPLVFNVDLDPYEEFPLDPNLHSGLLIKAKKIVEEHEQSIISVPNQLKTLNSKLQPCCNPPSCTCGYTTEAKDEL